MLEKIIKNPFFLIITSCFLVYFGGHPTNWLIKYGIIPNQDVWIQLTQTISFFVMMFAIPAIVIKLIFKKPLRDFGLSMPVDIKKSLLWTGLIILICLPPLYLFSLQSGFQNYYSVKINILYFIFYTITGIFYFFSEEFIFRGLLHFGLWDKFKFHTIWMVNLIFVIFHLGKPFPEICFSFVVGILLSFLSFKTKSFLPAVLVHFTLALFLNILVTFVFL